MGQLLYKDDHEGLKLFEYEVPIGKSNNSLDHYEDLMSKYGEWTSFKREVRLSGLLESGKRVQFDIESISITVPLGEGDRIVSVQSSAVSIKSMSFILKEDKIEKLTIKCKPLATPMGRIVQEILGQLGRIDIKPRIIDGKVGYFYVDAHERPAA